MSRPSDMLCLCSEYGWTMSHGYFIQMGGFMLYNKEKLSRVLYPHELDNLIGNGLIVMPQITEEEIQDRSKSDGLSKALVVIHTTWFICQCIARRLQGLIITELELVTLAFAALNGVMYMFWWFKPLDVQTTVRVDLLGDRNDISGRIHDIRSSELDLTQTPGSISETRLDDVTVGPEGIEMELENLIPSSEMRPHQRIIISKFRELFFSVCWLIGILFLWPLIGMVAVLARIPDIIYNSTHTSRAEGVPTFYTSYKFFPEKPLGEDLVALNFLPFVGILFGAIHCAGWNFSFPSLFETYIWRLSSALITCVPLMILLLEIYCGLQVWFGDNFFVPKSLVDNFLVRIIQDFLLISIVVITALVLLYYIVARLALLVVAFTTLRDLPPGALAAVEWTSFLPHI
ncbi:hypothetical protein GALMADRAFT_144669 [Galerina marginata CBS 339.88]|uniref:Uncharacterized protein n=1 Tax=Galerina marginata (strain CBS 339.88) TaxID=685588 RepID=A0A067SRN8_GALM3|nr:hypothetical protein GALMADRAFT_144669 [Galerina marginata CBS 339.88]